jgi:DNA helicase II / ATP-dependent DNA helicase PcrA
MDGIRSVMGTTTLNRAQREAVEHGRSPLLVLAGAGTGKTTVVTRRVAHLVERGDVGPGEVLAVTFTNKAAREMLSRTGEYLGRDPSMLSMGTFHGICARLLRRHGSLLGFTKEFVIYNQDDQLQMIKRSLKELGYDPQVHAPKDIQACLGSWKNKALKPDDVLGQKVSRQHEIASIVYKLYEKKCRQANGIDFGDLICHVIDLLKSYPEIRRVVQTRWRALFVDEYQDTNPAQYQFLKLLHTPEHILTVVGDDDQSIYRWRGADIKNILRFERDFPGSALIRLERNYRSTVNILDAANAVIACNVDRKGKTLFSEGAQGSALNFRLLEDERSEAEAVATQVNSALNQSTPPSEIAILYRVNAQSRPLEEAFRRRRIPYRIYGGMKFYERKEVRDALSYFRLMINPRSDIDFLRAVATPTRGIGKKSLEQLDALAKNKSCPLFEAAKIGALEQGTLTKRASKQCGLFVDFVEKYRQAEASSQMGLVELAQGVLEESGYITMLKSQGTQEAAERYENINELISSIREYCALTPEATLLGFLEEVALVSDIDALAQDAETISLMTLHSAKGLEFAKVWMPGMEEGLLPHQRSQWDRAQLEEERRLCYVGMTRAKQDLYMSATQWRYTYGAINSGQVSRFVSEIPNHLFATPHTFPTSDDNTFYDDENDDDDNRLDKAPTTQSQQRPPPTFNVDDSPRFKPGVKVLHRTFGEGAVMSVDGSGRRQKLLIDFPKAGQKVVVARFVEHL